MIGRNSSIKTVSIIWAHKRPTMIDCAIVQAKKKQRMNTPRPNEFISNEINQLAQHN